MNHKCMKSRQVESEQTQGSTWKPFSDLWQFCGHIIQYSTFREADKYLEQEEETLLHFPETG